jgi:hypothetical protein
VGLIESIRRWIDGEGGDDPLEAADENVRPRRVGEEFLVKLAREVEAVMQREMFTPPGGPTYIPHEYIIYLSNDDDKEWQGEKRRGLEQGLFHVLSERARELSGTTQLATKSFAVELRVDGTLNKGEFRVQAIWDEVESGKTSVTARHRSEMPSGAAPEDVLGINGLTTGELVAQSAESEMTIVRPRVIELYSVEVWKDGVRQVVVSVSKAEITIGRGSRSASVDLPIKADPEVSRIHATLALDGNGTYWLTAKGRNPTLINGREAPRDQRTQISVDDKIEICSYSLRIQPK